MPNRSKNIVGPCPDKPVAERCTACILDTSDYFSGLSVAAKLEMQSVLKLKSYGKRQTLYTEGSPSAYLYILLSGEAKICKSLADGRQQIHKIASIPGDLIACEDYFLEAHCSSAETIRETAVCYLRKEDLQAVMHKRGEVGDVFMRTMARNLNLYVRHIANLGQKTALERVASYLVFLSQTQKQRNLRQQILAESLTRTELADMLGITQRTLIRSLKALEKQRLVALTRDGFAILDMAALACIGDGC